MSRLPLAGVSVLELAGGAAAGYCGRLLVDAGAAVTVAALSPEQRQQGVVRAALASERAYEHYLSVGKTSLAEHFDAGVLQQLSRNFDLVLVGEASGLICAPMEPRVASIELSWFGRLGPHRDWQGCDLIVQALTGLPHMAGPVAGPPLYAGDRQSTTVAGVTAYIAAAAAFWAEPQPVPRHFEISILEANIVLSEMHMHFFERDGIAMQRHGINRFAPNSPVGIYPCKSGWVGITATTPEQWRSLCVALQMHELAADERLVTRELRFARLDEVEQAICAALATRSAFEWAALGRQHKVPIVVVPDARGILDHPIFKERQALVSLSHKGAAIQLPRTPFALSQTPFHLPLDDDLRMRGSGSSIRSVSGSAATTHESVTSDQQSSLTPPPLTGLTVVDFAMGWAGPLTGRLLADLGADVQKIEAGRYPDWWRGVNWTSEYIETRQYENAKGYCALNRGKRGVSVDLTTATGRELALALIAKADAVVENQAAGVMTKLGLGYEQVVAVNPQVCMVSMSAFGIGNDWSDTRAYGSTLEQGAGLPSFMGLPGTPPTMYQLAYGDPVGGLFGCAALLTALVHKRRTGVGQFANLSMVESSLQFATPALLEYQLSAEAPPRRGNRHAAMVPHGIYRCAGGDQWLALSVASDVAFASLARIIGQPHWSTDQAFASVTLRRQCEDQIDAAISAWTQGRSPQSSAQLLQASGVAAAPLLHAQDIAADAHLLQADFFNDLVREFSGPQRQAGTAFIQNGKRLVAKRPAPLLGEHSWEVLSQHTSLSRERYEQLVRDGVISFAPKALRSLAR